MGWKQNFSKLLGGTKALHTMLDFMYLAATAVDPWLYFLQIMIGDKSRDNP